MITIENHGTRYILKFSWPGTGYRSYLVKAINTAEVCEAIRHHLDGNHTPTKPLECPLCRIEETNPSP